MIAPLHTPPFPSEGWFATLAAHPTEEPDLYRDLGFADFRLVVEVLGPAASGRSFGLVFDGYDVISAGELQDPSLFRPEATISGPIEIWQDMLRNIAHNDGADRQHTLNALSIADVPLRVWSDDPMGKDKFFRYAQTLQALFDATARIVPVTA